MADDITYNEWTGPGVIPVPCVACGRPIALARGSGDSPLRYQCELDAEGNFTLAISSDAGELPQIVPLSELPAGIVTIGAYRYRFHVCFVYFDEEGEQ